MRRNPTSTYASEMIVKLARMCIAPTRQSRFETLDEAMR